MPSTGPLKWITNFFSAEEDEDDIVVEGQAQPAPQAVTPQQKRPRGPLTLHADQEAGMEIRHPRSLEDRMAIGMDLKQRKLVTLDLTHLPDADARYFLEFVYGVIFALDATAEKVTEGIYLLAPHGVAVRNDVDAPVETSTAFTPRITPRPSAPTNTREGQEELFWQAR